MNVLIKMHIHVSMYSYMYIYMCVYIYIVLVFMFVRVPMFGCMLMFVSLYVSKKAMCIYKVRYASIYV